jgi:hypothetical protein
MKRTVNEAIAEAARRITDETFVRAILTGSRKSKKPDFQRVDLRPVLIKGELKIQSISHDGKKDFTSNLPPNIEALVVLLDSGFSNVIVDSTTESYQIQITKKDEAITGIGKTNLERELDHDHKKQRLLPEDHEVFRALEMADSSGRIKSSKRDKYIQIDQLLRLIEPTLSKFQEGDEIRVVDLASGSAALTLAVHAYLSQRFKPTTIGVELNPDLVAKSESTARKAGLHSVDFENSAIKDARNSQVDILLALHACDRATDEVIDFTLKAQANVAFIVPCCHQTRPESVLDLGRKLPFFGRDGIVDERFLDLATDALRAERLRESAYDVEIVEFVGDEHTARNLLIRAIKRHP